MAKKLATKSVENVKATATRQEIPDALLPGLYLVVQPSGAKSWAVRYRHGGRPRKLTLGPLAPTIEGAPEPEPVLGAPLTLKGARIVGRQQLEIVATGRDPATVKKAARAEASDERNLYANVATDFVTRYARKKNRSWRETARLLGLREVDGELKSIKGGLADGRQWGKRRVQEITRRDVRELIEGIAERAPVAANRTLAAVRKLFNWCVERDILDASPIAGLPPPAAEASRDRILTDDEIRWFWKGCVEIGAPFGPFFRLLLVTAQRRGEVRAMTTGQLDLAERLWTIPAAIAKNNVEHVVPLAPQAVAIIEAAPRIKGKAGLIFTTNGETPVSGWSRAKANLDAAMLRIARKERKGATVPDWRLHDLRRTAASGMARLGQPVHVVEAALNHKSGTIKGVAAVYNRYSYADEKRVALEAWANSLDALLTGDSASNVVTLRSGKGKRAAGQRK